MGKWDDFRERLLGGRADHNIDFDDLCKYLTMLGFTKTTRGSHRSFRMAGVGEKINIQPLHDGKAKQYQVAQVRDAIERLGLYGMNMERYTDNYRTTMRWSDADHAYIVTMPALAGCMADGPTPEDALHELNIVADMWMADTRALGQDIPAPDRDLSTTRDLVGRVLTG